MKNLKRLVAVVLTVAMIFSMGTLVSADTATLTLSDVDSSTTVGKSVTELIKLGIINGYEDGTFRPDNTITRGEFAKIITTFLNIAQVASDTLNSGFDDVDSVNHWAKKYIKLAVDKGIVNGYTDGTFRADDPVKYVEAVKMLVASLNYTKLAQRYQTANGAWYQGYMAVAAEKGILDGASVNKQEDPASRGTVAVLVYNSLDVEVAQEVIGGGSVTVPGSGSSALEELLGKKEVTGVITDVYQTSISASATTLNKNEVIIKTSDGSFTCKVPTGTDTFALLGYKVSGYMEDIGGGEHELSQITRSKTNKVTKVDPASIDKSDENAIEFWESDTASRITRLNFSNDLKVIYNGKYVDSAKYGPEDFDDVTSGEIKLLSNDNNDEIDIAFVTSYQTVVVSSKVVNNDEVKLYGMYGTGEVSIPKKTSNYIYSVEYNGEDYDPANITKWDVVSIQRSHDSSEGKKVLNVIVTRSKVSGSIKEIISEDEIDIAGKNYKISQSLVRSTHADKPDFKLSDYVTVYLDFEGKIAAAAVSTESVSIYLAYLVNAEPASGIDSQAAVLIYGITGKTAKQTMQLADKVKVDGASISDNNDVLAELKKSSAVANATKIAADPALDIKLTEYAQLIRYTVNAAGKIDTIDTVVANASVTNDDLVQSISYPSSQYPSIKYSTSGKFTANSKAIFNANTSTKVIVIPKDVMDTDNYSVKTYSSTFSAGVGYNVEVYNKNDVDVAKYLLVYGGKSSDTTFNENSPFVIANTITGVENGDKLTGWNLKDGSEVTDLCSADEGTFNNVLTTGDIFRYTKNASGKALQIEKIFDIVDRTPQFIVGGVNVLTPLATSSEASSKRKVMIDDIARSVTDSRNRFYFGTVVGREDNQLSLTNTLYTDTCGITEDDKETFTITSSTKIYVYDLSASKVENMIQKDGVVESIRTVRELQDAGVTDMSEASQVLVYMSTNSVKTLIIFK